MNDKDKIIMKNVGKKIKLARINAHYTQEQLAEKTSLTSKFISQLERGISFGRANTIVALCNELNISPNFLFDDFINSKKQSEFPSIDINFIKLYIELDDYNKDVLKLFASHLIRLQNNNENNKLNAKNNEDPKIFVVFLSL